MGHIGIIIEKCRQAVGMSRKDLSENLCSEKYIYLIEKGERTPSANLLKLMGEKMGVFLFDFYPYLDCEDPLYVREKMNFFNMCRINLDFKGLKEATEEAGKMPDFNNKPWCFELQLNSIYYHAFEEEKYRDALMQSEKLLKEVKAYGVTHIFLINAHTLMTTCSLVIGDIYAAKKSALNAYELIRCNDDSELYERMLTKVIVNLMGAHYVNNEFDDVIKRGSELLDIKHKRDSYGKIHFVHFFMALAFYCKDRWDDAAKHLKKAVCFLMADSKPSDVNFIAMDGRFTMMLNDLSPYSEVINFFRKEYGV
jgi:transcriptional regulator with XRE-family HTH domain